MNNNITCTQVIARLEENNLNHAIMPLQNNVKIVVTERGGRILGPFLTDDSASILWLNVAFAQPAGFKEFLKAGDWNLGGERIWLAPEVLFNLTDKDDFAGSNVIQPPIDPGQYTLFRPTPAECRLHQAVALEMYNLASGKKRFTLERVISPVDDPLTYVNGYPGLTEGVIFAGYEQIVTLTELEPDNVMSQSWNLVQLNPGGRLLIPTTIPVEPTVYQKTIDETFHAVHLNFVELNITGNRQYKVGYKAAHLLGRMGYLNRFDNYRDYLFIRHYANNPSSPYIDAPNFAPYAWGDSAQVYNDSGDYGGFGEMECHGQTIGGRTKKTTGMDPTITWLYVGQPEQIKTIARHLLGVTI